MLLQLQRLIADAAASEWTLLRELSHGATGIALGLIIAAVMWLFYRVRYELPRMDAQVKARAEETEALNELSRAIWSLIAGSDHHTENAKEEARKGITRIESKQK